MDSGYPGMPMLSSRPFGGEAREIAQLRAGRWSTPEDPRMPDDKSEQREEPQTSEISDRPPRKEWSRD